MLARTSALRSLVAPQLRTVWRGLATAGGPSAPPTPRVDTPSAPPSPRADGGKFYPNANRYFLVGPLPTYATLSDVEIVLRQLGFSGLIAYGATAMCFFESGSMSWVVRTSCPRDVKLLSDACEDMHKLAYGTNTVSFKPAEFLDWRKAATKGVFGPREVGAFLGSLPRTIRKADIEELMDDYELAGTEQDITFLKGHTEKVVAVKTASVDVAHRLYRDKHGWFMRTRGDMRHITVEPFPE